MRFTIIASALALAAGANAALSADQVTTNVDALTQKSVDTNDLAEKISVVSLFAKTPQVLTGLRDIVAQAHDDISAMTTNKRSMQARQQCASMEDVQKCMEDLKNTGEDPNEIVGKKRRQDPAYSDAEQQGLCTAFRGYSQGSQKLLKTIVDKHGLLSLTRFEDPMSALLHNLEDVSDILAFKIIDAVPNCVQDAISNKDSLDQILEEALEKYTN
ncbi:uncharacterized protein N7500_001585 [Penicillium coprophilum]|uniref:uncharacterized protein n=1 Tax=Penicillium coprophilum TaxID=36646 RepID=UPI002386F8B6|nr:uncharacterized protein N7500_001585 [Penicillium coprophilum]KAJ5173654.1 hypothetical protein N7500_001585 [Penicillium coprophilum]